MHPVLTRPLDRLALGLGGWCVRRPCAVPARAAEAAELLQRGDYFSAATGWVPELKFRANGDFEFPSAVETPAPESNTVFGRLHRVEGQWQTRPSVILLHGWNDELGYRLFLPLLARQLVRAGINAALLELPYHARRRPGRAAPVRNILSEDLLQVITGLRQALADIRALHNWLQAQGCPRTGLLGVSMGAWLAGLTVCADPRPACAALLVPPARMDRAAAQLAFCAPIRRALGGTTFNVDRLNLTAHRPVVPPERVLIVKSEHDLVVPPDTLEELARAWPGSEVWRVPHGHISVLLSRSLMQRMLHWVECCLLETTHHR